MFRPMVTLLMVIGIAFTVISPSGADLLPERDGVDAGIAQGIVKRPDRKSPKGSREERIHALIPDADRSCMAIDRELSPQRKARTEQQTGLATALEKVRKSTLGAWLVQRAAAEEVTICLDSATSLEAHYRSHIKLLGLSSRLSPAGRVVFLAHELAHVPQHPRFSNNRRFSPGDMLLLQRVREAAAEAVATRVLWQLREQGITAPWQAKLRTAYYDIAEEFEATMAGGEGTARELWATRSAFHLWFKAAWRLEIYDDLMIKTLTRIAQDPIGLIPPSRHLSDGYLRGIADYADQGFLIGGDGDALIQSFENEGLPGGGQPRLDAIVANTGRSSTAPISSVASETLSAISPETKLVNEE